MRRGHRLGAAAAALSAAVAVSGCAARQATLGGRFIKGGEPTVQMEGPDAAPAGELQDYMRKVRALQSQPKTKASLLPTIEANSPELSRALFVLAVQETAENHRRVAGAYMAAGVRDFAFRHFQRAVALEPCDAAAYDGLARLWRDWGMPTQAMGEAYRGLRCAPDSAPLYNTLGTIMQSAGQLENARGAYAKAVMLAPGAAYALNNICYLEIAGGQAEAAIGYCQAALQAAPEMVTARNNLALAQTLSGDAAGAERTLARAGGATTRYNVGVLKWARGEFAEAAEAFDDAADARPSFGLARKRAVQARRAAMETSGDQR